MTDNVQETKHYYNEEHFTMSYKQLLTASHWVCEKTGEQVKLSHNIKAIYSYRLDQYRSFSKEGKKYMESVAKVADVLAVSVDVSKETQALLIRMGLMVVEQPGTRTAFYTVFPLKFLKGKLINTKLEKHHRKPSKRRKVSKESATWEEIQAIQHNCKQMEKVKKKKEKVYLLTREDMDRLRGSKADKENPH